MKKYSILALIASFYFASNAYAGQVNLEAKGVKVNLTYEDESNSQEFYTIEGSIKTPDSKTDCSIPESKLAYYGNSSSDRVNVTCGSYIVRFDTAFRTIKNASREGYLFELITQIDYYGPQTLSTLATVPFELRFHKTKVVEVKSDATTQIDKH